MAAFGVSATFGSTTSTGVIYVFRHRPNTNDRVRRARRGRDFRQNPV